MSLITLNNLGELPRPKFKYITSTEEALKHLEFIEKHPVMEIDTETTGLDPFTDKVVLLQIGVDGQPFVFDVREGNVDINIFRNLLESNNNLKLLQNALFDAKMLKSNFGITIKRLYDTMLAEQLLFLGLKPEANLQYLVAKYLRLYMPKDIATSFKDYYQEYSERQLVYAANDVVILKDIYNLQLKQLKNKNLIRAAKLEFDFVRALSEIELNGMLLDVNKWRDILKDIEIERDKVGIQLQQILGETSSQNTLFGVSLINLDSPIQLVKALNKLGINVESTDVKALKKYSNNPVIKLLLEYRKYEKFLTTYGEALIERIHPKTGRLHSDFKQMVDTGRLSSSNPNLQNIPSEKIYRACFIARPGHKLITSDMSQAELRILAAYSKDPVFLEAFEKGLDLHARTAADLFGVTYEEVLADKKLPDDDPNKKHYRSHVKALNFGLCIKEGTEILTVNGLVPIESIKLGDVIIHDVGQGEVIDFKFMGYKKTVCLELDNGYKLVATPDHIVKVISNNIYMDKAIKDLNKFDLVRVMDFNNLVIKTSGIKSIMNDGTYRVYDISVNNHPYYIANGVVVHNCYGLTKVGLALRLGVSEEKAQKLIDQYFAKYTKVAKWLEAAGKFALQNGYSLSRSGRRRHYKIPNPSDPEYNRLKGHIERQGKNMPIQSTNADTIKQAMIYIVDRIDKAKLLSTVHDEVIVETKEEDAEEVAHEVSKALCDGFAEFVPEVQMKADAVIENYWSKD